MAELMTVEELGRYLRFTKKTIYGLLKQGDIPAFKIGNKWRFDKDLIEHWLSQNLKEPNASILVIDDDITVCDLFKETLEGVGHSVATTSDPYRGLEMIGERDYDLVFLDLKMPGMNGSELFSRIRLVKPKLPVTIITGFPDSDLMMEALAHGPLGVMSKPFTASNILEAVNNYLRFNLPVK